MLLDQAGQLAKAVNICGQSLPLPSLLERNVWMPMTLSTILEEVTPGSHR